jgi:uncharacterized caspase-like protein
LAEKIEVTYTPVTPAKPKLFVVAIGVSEFTDKSMNLSYAAKDANDLASLLSSKTDLYQEIDVQKFTNQQATRDNILLAKAKLMKSGVNDEVIVFVASHGLLDANLDYYIATHNVNFANPSLAGLKYEALESLLDGIPARKKLLLIDACHSGEVDKEEGIATNVELPQTEQGVKARGFKKLTNTNQNVGLSNSFELMKDLFADLRKGTGTVVISSASGKEFAFESSEWTNGVFTYSLLEGLKSGKADLNKDKSVQVSELRDYVSQRVRELTNGQQNPTSRTENLENDFRVW